MRVGARGGGARWWSSPGGGPVVDLLIMGLVVALWFWWWPCGCGGDLDRSRRDDAMLCLVLGNPIMGSQAEADSFSQDAI